MSDDRIPLYSDLVKDVKLMKEQIEFLVETIHHNNRSIKLIRETIQDITKGSKMHVEMSEDLAKRLKLIEQKLKMENPGDINHLYQNWGKH